MICPICQEGTLLTIEFKHSGKRALTCDFCETLWFEGDIIDGHSRQTLQSYSRRQGDESKYTELEDPDDERKPLTYVAYW